MLISFVEGNNGRFLVTNMPHHTLSLSDKQKVNYIDDL